MNRLRIVVAVLFMLLGFAMTGCLKENLLVEPELNPSLSTGNGMAKFTTLAGVTLESATLHIFVKENATDYNDPNNEPVYIFRVTAPWTENTVTWDNIGTSFDETDTIGTFIASPGWQTADVTSLVQMWLSGVDDYGLLINQADDVAPWGVYNSREAGVDTPYISVTYSLRGQSHTVTLADTADSHIFSREGYTGRNYGSDDILDTGYRSVSTREAQSLLKFEGLQIPEEEIKIRPGKVHKDVYAYGDGYAHWFSEFRIKKWGWINKIPTSGQYILDLYSVAGKFNLSKAIKVGELLVDYGGTSVEITYNLDDRYTLKKVQFYIGSDPFQVHKKGKKDKGHKNKGKKKEKFILAPGHFPLMEKHLKNESSYSYTTQGLSGETIYIIAQAEIHEQHKGKKKK